MQNEIRVKIVRAAKAMFGQHGFRKASLADIAHEARMGKSSLYHYFRSKEELFRAVVNMEMQVIGIDIAHFLHERTYPTLPLPSSGWAGGPKGHHGVFSHRHAAVLAGLGGIGLNNLLLTPKYGPRVRLNSIITTAELQPDPLVAEKLCREEECMLCMKAENCFGELYDLDLGGKKMKVARFMGCDKDLCKRSNPNAPLPYIRDCIGVCPVGK